MDEAPPIFYVLAHHTYSKPAGSQWLENDVVLNIDANGIHVHFYDVSLVAGEGFEPSKAELGDLQSPHILHLRVLFA